LKAVLKKIGKKYLYIKHLGGGTYSNVYLVKHTILGEHHVLKIMDYNFIRQKFKDECYKDIKKKFKEIKARFINEARLYKKIDSPNIVKIYDIDMIEGHIDGIEIPYFLMAYIEGSTLANILKNEAPLEMSRVMSISRDVLNALEVIHGSNIIHRDLKPANIMIEKETGRAVLIDFGIARDVVDGAKLTTNGALLGSPGYMAPEQFVDSSETNFATDIYAFGVVLFEMLVGEVPFKGHNFLEIMNAHRKKPVPHISEKKSGLPPGMDDILLKSMAKEPKKRYKSAADFRDALELLREEKKHAPSSSIKYLKYLFYLIIPAIICAVLFFTVLFPGLIKQEKQETFVTFPEPKNPTEFIFKETGRIMPQWEPGIKTDRQDRQYLEYIEAAKVSLQEDDYETAAGLAKKAKAIKDTGEIKQLLEKIKEQKDEDERKNGTRTFNALKENIDLQRYLAFKGKYPGSRYLPELENRLKAADKTLPPEKYWTRPIKKNGKGYYEYTFGKEHNGHIMVYIPGRKIWFDKYEVSWGQFRKFLRAEKIQTPPIKNTQYIHDGDEFPAIASYKNAGEYCKANGFRLPTEDEWEYAAGKGENLYPWGNQSPDIPDAAGNWPANYDCFEDGFKGTAPVKSFAKFASPFGPVNMAGNVWEWVQGRILKGGGFFSDKEELIIKKSKSVETYDREGFRCVKDETQGVENEL
jgi:serine/threonine protein kinase